MSKQVFIPLVSPTPRRLYLGSLALLSVTSLFVLVAMGNSSREGLENRNCRMEFSLFWLLAVAESSLLLTRALLVTRRRRVRNVWLAHLVVMAALCAVQVYTLRGKGLDCRDEWPWTLAVVVVHVAAVAFGLHVTNTLVQDSLVMQMCWTVSISNIFVFLLSYGVYYSDRSRVDVIYIAVLINLVIDVILCALLLCMIRQRRNEVRAQRRLVRVASSTLRSSTSGRGARSAPVLDRHVSGHMRIVPVYS
eukprot:TRINITY_DN94982_c0_g1_i1.p1 TRINITY_DN94982_c0_g1~~TRINITY_DN94982_c0_g1_i1.p1  ORF type:complete len:249 (-),score=92.87 TRINITY_DN94982_c0_g1_i1:140-886(-)